MIRGNLKTQRFPVERKRGMEKRMTGKTSVGWKQAFIINKGWLAGLLASVNAGTSKAPRNRGLKLTVAIAAFIDETSKL